jgi:ElaA protein
VSATRAHDDRAKASVWRCVPFDSLSARELQGIYIARQRVFAIEQACAFLDADGFDELAHHLTAWSPNEHEPFAYARLLQPGAKYAEASIGRVLTALRVRGRGVGRELMVRALALVGAIWPGAGVRISAQTQLEPFYASLGFAAIGPPYLEDGIDHTEMLRRGDAVTPSTARG